ncbi:MAG: zinc-finger domain-containing protein [Alphaproteobacteria bacterium]
MDPEEPIYVDTPIVACDGGGDALGHPKVFLKFDEEAEVVCPYCSKRYLLNPDGPVASHGH